jgi:hypothetical protein
MAGAALILAVATTRVSGRLERERDIARIACADREVSALVDDVAAGGSGTRNLWRMRRVHKRIWSAINEGYVEGSALGSFNHTTCDGPPRDSANIRHQFGIDPWGSPYWLEVERTKDQHDVAVYSFGPNRRRDANVDDIRRAATRRPPSK